MMRFIVIFSLIAAATAECTDKHLDDDYLVTMSCKELNRIFYDVALSGNKDYEQEAKMCIGMSPPQVVDAFNTCSKQVVNPDPNEFFPTVAKDPKKLEDLYECKKKIIKPLNDEEKVQMTAAENCGRALREEMKNASGQK